MQRDYHTTGEAGAGFGKFLPARWIWSGVMSIDVFLNNADDGSPSRT
jgi:hypothetical protein